MPRNPAIACLLLALALVASTAIPALGATPPSWRPDRPGLLDLARGTSIEEVDDETHSHRDARALTSGDAYRGHLDRVGDRADYFWVTAAQHQVVNVHVRVLGHDGIDEWVRPATTSPPSPPPAGTASAMLNTYIYHAPGADYPLDGAFNYYYVRDYVVNICAPVPGTHAYLVNVTIDWRWTPNNMTWDYLLELDVGPVPEMASGGSVEATIDLACRDTLWYRVQASRGREVNGSLRVLDFDEGDPGLRDVNVWVFADDLGGFPRSLAWDWSAAPNEPVEPFSILATYDGWYYIKLRGMNHEDNVPCSVRLDVDVQDVPEFPEGGVQSARLDRQSHDTDWYRFDMGADRVVAGRPGLWNDARAFNMTERADGEDLPDFDLYLFGLPPDGRQLDLLDSSIRNDHASFSDPERDPTRNTEQVRAAAFYSGTYYLEVNAWNNTGLYDLRMETPDPRPSDGDNLPRKAASIRAGVYTGAIHQAFDHYDWYKIETHGWFRVQFDSYQTWDMFNVSVHRYDHVKDTYVPIAGGWNVEFNLTSREDEISNIVDLNVELDKLGLGSGTYYVSVIAAVATGTGSDPASGRVFVYSTDDDAKADYELRVWTNNFGPPPPPPPVRPIPDTVVEEDTSLPDVLDLDYYFYYEEGLKYRAVVVSGKLEGLVLEGSHLGFVAAPDYAGKVIVKVIAIDENYLQRSLTWNITFTPVNDPPRSLVVDPPVVVNMTEDQVLLLDLGAFVQDVDKGDVLTVTTDPPYFSITLDDDSMVAEVLGAPNLSGEFPVDLVFTDQENASLTVSFLFVVKDVPDAPVLARPFGTVVTPEDVPVQLDIGEHIHDGDGIQLDVEIGMDQSVSASYDQGMGVLTLTPARDWTGTTQLLVTASDPEGHVLHTVLWLEVTPVMDAPEIVSVTPPGTEVRLREGSAVTFATLEVRDPDSDVYYYWYLDNDYMGPVRAITYQPGIHDQGGHVVRVEVVDATGLRTARSWNVTVEDVPHPLEGGIASPADGSVFAKGEAVTFVAVFWDADGDLISYRWSIDGTEASTDPEFQAWLGPGSHRIELEVRAGPDVVTAEVVVTVQPSPVGPLAGTGLVAAVALAVAGASIIIALTIIRRRRSTPPDGSVRGVSSPSPEQAYQLEESTWARTKGSRSVRK